MNVLIVGASRGIGLEFVRQYRADGAQVLATARGDEALRALRDLGASAQALDVALDDFSGLASAIDGRTFDVAVVCAGIYGPRSTALEAPPRDEFDAVMRTNVFGAMHAIAHVQDALAPGARLAVISSRMASIGPRRSPAAWLYRASKAALNSVLRDASLALDGRAICVAFHPGWVRTAMGGESASLSPEQSVADMRRVIASLEPTDNGAFLNHDGTPIDW